MKFNDNITLPAWVKNKKTIGVVLDKEEGYFMVQKGDDKQLYPTIIKDFELLICSKESEVPFHCSSMQNDIPDVGLNICFNITKNKALICRKLDSEVYDEITQLFFIWTTENDIGCNRGLFLEQVEEKKYKSFYWTSDWGKTGNEEANKVMMGLFIKLCLLNGNSTEKSPETSQEVLQRVNIDTSTDQEILQRIDL